MRERVCKHVVQENVPDILCKFFVSKIRSCGHVSWTRLLGPRRCRFVHILVLHDLCFFTCVLYLLLLVPPRMCAHEIAHFCCTRFCTYVCTYRCTYLILCGCLQIFAHVFAPNCHPAAGMHGCHVTICRLATNRIRRGGESTFIYVIVSRSPPRQAPKRFCFRNSFSQSWCSLVSFLVHASIIGNCVGALAAHFECPKNGLGH